MQNTVNKLKESIESRQKRTLNLLARYSRTLPILPTTVLKLSQPQASNMDQALEEATGMDPALAIRLAFEDRHRFISSDKDVPSIGSILYHLGTNNILEDLKKCKKLSIFKPQTTGERELWLHSVQVALLSRYIAKLPSNKLVDPEEAYLAGLIHDLGRFIMLCEDSNAFNELSKHHVETGLELIAAEKEICGYDHSRLGMLAARSWNFPEQLVASIGYHHRVGKAAREYASPKTIAVCEIVGIADLVSFGIMAHPGFAESSDDAKIAYLQSQGMACPPNMHAEILPALKKVILPLHKKMPQLEHELFG